MTERAADGFRGSSVVAARTGGVAALVLEPGLVFFLGTLLVVSLLVVARRR